MVMALVNRMSLDGRYVSPSGGPVQLPGTPHAQGSSPWDLGHGCYAISCRLRHEGGARSHIGGVSGAFFTDHKADKPATNEVLGQRNKSVCSISLPFTP